jgi:hypothetical protein
MTYVWILVILINVDNAGRTVGPFESEAACEQAVARMRQVWQTPQRFGACVKVLNK